MQPGSYEGTIHVRVENRTHPRLLKVKTVVISQDNIPPVSDAGTDQTAYVTDTVYLDGSNSTDVDGDLISCQWSIISTPLGSTTALSDSTAVYPNLDIDLPGTYVVQLRVNDGTVDSVPDTMTITTLNSPPVSDAGPDQTAYVTDTVYLDGSNSYDVDLDLLYFQWTIISTPEDSTATLSDPFAVNPYFDIDLSGTYVVQLMVNDGTVDGAPDTMTVTTLNSLPVSDAGEDQTAYVGDTVYLDGSNSTDVDDDPLDYQWSIISTPVDSTATLSDPFAVNPYFDIDLSGTYVVQLMVNDGTVDGAPDTMTVTTLNSLPVSDAGEDQTAHIGDTVYLDGSNSTDVDGDLLSCQWSIISTPLGVRRHFQILQQFIRTLI